MPDGTVRDLIALVDELIETGNSDPAERAPAVAALWHEMMAAIMRSIREDVSSFDWVAVHMNGTLGYASDTRLVPPHLELVLFIEVPGAP